jgi:hypothetical protein
MTEFLDRDFLELTMNQVSDLLLDKLHENQKDEKEYSCAKLVGGDVYGRRYELLVVMREVSDDDSV